MGALTRGPSPEGLLLSLTVSASLLTFLLAAALSCDEPAVANGEPDPQEICSKVTQDNWPTSSPDGPPQEVCLLGSSLIYGGATPCTLGGVRFFCREEQSGGMELRRGSPGYLYLRREEMDKALVRGDLVIITN